MIRVLVVTLVLILTGCGLSIGEIYTPEGPHPQINVAVEGRIGPVAIFHAPVSNADPVTDLTVITVNKGVNVGSFQPNVGAGWQLSRLWGTCDSTGHACKHTYINGYALSAGLTYRASPLRIDLRALAYDNSPVGARTNLPLGAEALVLLFGFDL